MAKVTNPVIPPELAEIAARTIQYTTQGAQTFARRWWDRPTPDADTQLRWQQRIADAATSWNGLSLWKRARWTVCAYRHGIPSNPLGGVQHFSGFTLYVKCWLEQKTVLPRQPISPCSRRATDPGASPFDFTP